MVPGAGEFRAPVLAFYLPLPSRRLDQGATAADGVCTLRGADVRRILEQEFGVLYALPSVYKLLHRLGYSSLAPRPRHKLADPVAQEAFKKSSR